MPLEEISCDDETFRISEELDNAGILESMRRIGQLNPVILLDQKHKTLLVSGFRRVRILKQLGATHALVRILSADAWTAAKAFELAFWDNLSHRQLNPLETARALFKLRSLCGIDDKTLLNSYLPALGFSSSPTVLAGYILLNSIHDGLRQCLLEGRLTLSSIESLAPHSIETQERFALLMSKIRLSASLQKKFLGILDNLASMKETALDAPLREPQILALLDDASLSPFQKGDKVYENLYMLMNPRLSQAHERFRGQRQRLNLPGSIQVNAHPYFEEPGVRVEFSAADPERFRRLVASLHLAAQSPDLDKLFEVE